MQPPSPTHPPVLYYTVTHNVSGNGSELAFNTTTNEAILNGARYEVTYFISILAVNEIGKGKSKNMTFTFNKTIRNGKINCKFYKSMFFFLSDITEATSTAVVNKIFTTISKGLILHVHELNLACD